MRYGIRKASDTLIEDSLEVVDRILRVETPCGPCWRRYNHDGYGQRDDGGPFLGWGRGRAWPLLTGERGHYELAAGRDPRPYILALERFAGQGLLPEQIWDAADMPEERLWLGQPTGSAMPLVWAHAEYLTLVRSVTGPLGGRRSGVRLSARRGGALPDGSPTAEPGNLETQSARAARWPRPARCGFRPRPTSCCTGPSTNGGTREDTPSTPTGLSVHYVDIPLAAAQRVAATVHLLLAGDRSLGRSGLCGLCRADGLRPSQRPGRGSKC